MIPINKDLIEKHVAEDTFGYRSSGGIRGLIIGMVLSVIPFLGCAEYALVPASPARMHADFQNMLYSTSKIKGPLEKIGDPTNVSEKDIYRFGQSLAKNSLDPDDFMARYKEMLLR